MRRSVRIATPARRMSVRDAGFLYLERPRWPIHIGCVAILEGVTTPEDLASRIEGRLARTPRYGQRALDVPFGVAHPTWEGDPRFDVRNHLHRWALPSPGGEAELYGAIAQLMMLPIDRSRPLLREFTCSRGCSAGGPLGAPRGRSFRWYRRRFQDPVRSYCRPQQGAHE